MSTSDMIIIGFILLGIVIVFLWTFFMHLEKKHKFIADEYAEYGMHGIDTSHLVQKVVEISGYVDWSITTTGEYLKVGIMLEDGTQYITTNFFRTPLTPNAKKHVLAIKNHFQYYKDKTMTFTLVKISRNRWIKWQSEYALIDVN